MWIRKKNMEELEKRIADLEKKVELQQHSLILKLCTNSIGKELYNLELLKYLFEKLGIEKPILENKFTWGETSSNENG